MNAMENKTFYVYGGMKKGQNTKLHLCYDNAKSLCGVNSFWMEAGYSTVNEKGFIEGEEHLPSIIEDKHTCKKCLAKWIKIK